jgi:hypothetical protein
MGREEVQRYEKGLSLHCVLAGVGTSNSISLGLSIMYLDLPYIPKFNDRRSGDGDVEDLVWLGVLGA